MVEVLKFLPAPPDASLIYEGAYSPTWVIVSVLLAILASYAALCASKRIGLVHNTSSRLTWAWISAFTLGIGIWAMHFIGMLALSLPCGIRYDPFITLISMAPSILASGVALGVAWHGDKRLSLLVRSVLLGAGIGTMHYTGMAAMRLDGFVRYDPALFALSIVVAVALSYFALYVKSGVARLRKWHEALVAIILGSATAGMHYTGMSAAYFVRGDVADLPASVFTTNTLAVTVALTTVFLALGALALAAISRNREMTDQLRDSEARWKFALEGAGDGVWDWNPQTNDALFSRRWKDMLGYAEDEFPDTGAAWIEHLHPDDRDRVLAHIKDYFAGSQPLYVVEFRMRCKDGSWKWILARGKLISSDVDGNPLRMIGTHADITERKLAEERINELAFFDQLTGLPNRTLLLDRLKQAMIAGSRNGSYGALLFIDLDNFKTLNDTYGHNMGDVLLKQVAQRLMAGVRESDSVARLGGDEFVVLLAGLGTSEKDSAMTAEMIAEKVLGTLGQIYRLGEVAHQSTVSIGITLFMGLHTCIEDLMKQADLAMYKSKGAGRNTLRFFDPEMEIAVMNRAGLEKDLREAIEGKQFLLHYQAQLVGEERVTGAEVLLRWPHPKRGMVSPAEFIPLAEETGLILPLGHWVLEAACTQLAVWATRPEMAHLTIAVNVSVQQFNQNHFVDQVLSVLDHTGANPQRLKLELTESLLVGDVQSIIEKMVALKEKGVGFSLDDFGTGYSSLSYLKRLPLDQLKIDQSFVHDVLTDPNDAAIARTIVALARSLGLDVIAEGVETEAQRDFLDASGCHAYQGYFFSRPLPLDGFEAFALQAVYA